jgi:tetrahydromethanopterin S-methyltransferase subunit G
VTNIVTVTKSTDTPRCGWCHRPLLQLSGAGRPRRFCSPSHRQRSYEARRRAESFRLPNGQVIVSEDDLQKVHDRLYLLESAIEDVDADLAGDPGPKAYRAAFDHLYEAAKDLVGVVVEAVRQ